MIERLSDKVLLDIFRYYLDVVPWHWPRLVHICRGWRRLVFASQQSLHLRLICTYRTRVLKSLDCWPALPIVIQYERSRFGRLPAPTDVDSIVAALKQSDRVSSINLTVTDTLLEKLSAIDRPFPALEDLRLLSQDRRELTLPRAFRWGQRLRSLHLTGISLFALPQLLHSSGNLVDIQLHAVLNPWFISPEALTDALSGMTQLRSLSLHFLSTYRHVSASPLPRKLVVTPSLTRLDFRGDSKYLEDLVVEIEAPHLGDIELSFFNKTIPELPKLNEFINRIEMHKSHRRVDIRAFANAVSISFIQPGASTRIKLEVFCEPISTQLPTMARIVAPFSASLLDLEDLEISATPFMRNYGPTFMWEYELYHRSWLELLNTFTRVKWLYVSASVAKNLLTDIAIALQLPDKRSEPVLPAWHKLYITQPGPHPMSWREGMVALMTSRMLSGHPIAVEYEIHTAEQCLTGVMYASVTPITC